MQARTTGLDDRRAAQRGAGDSAILGRRRGQPLNPVFRLRTAAHALEPHLTQEDKEMKRTILAILSAAATLAVTSPAFADEALAKSKNCMACHAVDKKVVGPAYKDVAKKYAGDAKAADMLASKIIKGGSGVWGPVPMPANAQVNDAEAKKLVAWVMSMK
jgi:cytochrome c